MNSDANTEEPAGEVRPSAIERQMATAALVAERSGQRGKKDRTRRRWSQDNDDADKRNPAIWTVIAVLLLLAVGIAALIFPEVGRPVQDGAQIFGQEVKRVAASLQSVAITLPKEVAPAVSQVPPPKPAAATTTLSIPIEPVSLRETPELLAQLVAVYRAQIANNPGNPEAQDTLARLREKSFREMTGIVAGASPDVAVKSFETISRLFPELQQDSRYQLLAARVEGMRHEREQVEAPSTDAAAPTTAATSAAETPAAIPAELHPQDTPKAIAKPTKEKRQEKAIPSRPDIRVAAAIPGEMQSGRFIPAQGGHVILLAINYQNLSSHRDSSLNSQLEIRLGNVRGPEVLAETTTEIAGDRGTKNIPMETFIQGYVGETFKLNFILDGELLASQKVRLSAPSQEFD